MPQPPAHKPLGTPFIELQSVDSTNNYARRLIQAVNRPGSTAAKGFGDNTQEGGPAKTLHGTAIFAHEQLAGKGQRGKTWSSEKNANIILSVVVDPGSLQIGDTRGQPSQQFHLSACAATALHEFFVKYAGNPTTIKWPNDLYWKDAKAGGILIESGISSNHPEHQTFDMLKTPWNWAIIGIGVNINQTSFLPGIVNPVSLKQITGRDFPTVDLANELCQILDKKFIQLNKEGFTCIYEYYLEYLYKKDKKVKLKKGNQVFEGVIKGISKTGRLIVQHGIEEEFDFGTIEWIL